MKRRRPSLKTQITAVVLKLKILSLQRVRNRCRFGGLAGFWSSEPGWHATSILKHASPREAALEITSAATRSVWMWRWTSLTVGRVGRGASSLRFAAMGGASTRLPTRTIAGAAGIAARKGIFVRLGCAATATRRDSKKAELCLDKFCICGICNCVEKKPSPFDGLAPSMYFSFFYGFFDTLWSCKYKLPFVLTTINKTYLLSNIVLYQPCLTEDHVF